MVLSEVAILFTASFPEYRQDLENHILEFDEILSYVFFCNIYQDYVKKLLMENTEKTNLIKLFNFFEQMAIDEHQDIKDLLSLTILDNMRDNTTTLEVGASYCGLGTLELLNDILVMYGHISQFTGEKSIISNRKQNKKDRAKKKNKDSIIPNHCFQNKK